MSVAQSDRFVLSALASSLVAAPALLVAVATLHFRHPASFFDFKASYIPRPASSYVPALIAGANRAPLLHDPHMLGYLGLPLMAFAAIGLYVLGRGVRPLASACALAVSLAGVVYVGGVFGAWTAFFRGFGDVDPRYTEGAIATWAALTAPRGALLVTTSLAKLGVIGPALQALCLARTRAAPPWAPCVAAAGYALIGVFWDLDNWMLLGNVLVLVAMLPLRARLLALRPA